jgi:hypothetical protein
MNRVLVALIGTGAFLVVAGTASARVASERIGVSATVVSTCQASSNLAALGTNMMASPLAVSCSTAYPITVTVNADTAAGGLLAARLMNSAYGVPGSLYTPAARVGALADRAGSVATTLNMPAGGSYGPSLTDASPGSEGIAPTGVVTVTVNY